MTTPLARARSHHYSPPKTSFLEARGRTLQLSIRPISQSQSSQSTEHTEPLEEFSDDEFDCCSEDERELLKLDIDQIVARHPILIQQTTSFTSNWSSSQINSQPRNLPPGFVPELAPAPTKDRVKGYLAKWLIDQGPFSISTCSTREGMTFHLNHEVARVALQTGIPISELMMVVHDNRGFKFIWDCLTEAVNVREKSMPEPSQQDLFLTESFDWDCVTPSGKLTMAWDTNKKRNDRPFFEFQVRPLSRRQKSNRFTRKFGSDRFFELDVPLPSKESLPSELNKGKADLEATREFVMEWLYGQSHFFLERQWRALFPKPSERRTRKPGEARANGLKVYLFAEKGLGIEHQDEMPVFKVMDWFLSVNLNLHQPSLKLFARLRMGLSTTTPTIVFEAHQVLRTRDAYSKISRPRSLNADIHIGLTQPGGYTNFGEVMNDGCARMSKAAHEAVAVILGFARPYPAAFQARIGGAKGMWMVDLLEELTPDGDEVWIEITDSQLKFETDSITSDEHHRTFEVVGWPKSVTAADLNVQLITILADRGIPPEVLERLMEESLTAEVNAFNEAIEDPTQIPEWIWDRNRESITEDRLRSGSIKWFGGIPLSNSEKILMLANNGFAPNSIKYLRDRCETELMSYLEKLAMRLTINVGQSSNLVMLADPLGVLDENEVHVCFSRTFTDKLSGFESIFLDNIDVLVARSPANLPSDIQKVRAVFKTGLSKYQDVIVFPSLGSTSLASKLSGGDYDGDIAWVCWDQRIVSPFISRLPPTIPPPAHYGIKKDTTKVSDLYDQPSGSYTFVMSGLKFNSIPSQLGIATNYRDYMVYKRNNISDPISMELAGLLSHLVDAAKGGLTFDADDFRTWKKNNHLQMEYEKPAYKSHYPPERMENILDRLEFNVVRKMMAQTRREFSKKAEEIPTYDSDLTIVWKSEQERAASDPALKAILTDLCKKFEPLWPYFVDNCRRSDDDPNPYATKKSKQKSGPNISAANHLRQMFLDITPLQLSGPDQSTFHPLLSIPHNSSSLYDHLWLLIKASALYMKFHNKRSVFPWVVCGKELAELKAREVARRNGSTPMVVIEEMYLGLKPDRKYVGGVKRKRGEMGGDDSFGDDGDDGDVDGDDYGD